MFQSSWIGAVGLAIEIVGLFFLFRDLLSSKSTAGGIAEFQKLQDDLEVANRELALRTHSGLQSFMGFMRSYLSVLEVEAREAAQPTNLAQIRQTDPDLAGVIDYIHGKGAVGLRHDAVANFVKASGDLLSRADVERALSLNAATRSLLVKQYADQVAEAARLRKIATTGIAFVAVGALLQLVDLVV